MILGLLPLPPAAAVVAADLHSFTTLLLTSLLAAVSVAVLLAPTTYTAVYGWRRRATLRRKAEFMAFALEDSPMAFAVYDARLRYTYVNQAMATLLGRSKEEILGRAPSDMISPQDADSLLPPLWDVLENDVTHLDLHHTVHRGDTVVHIVANRYPLHGPRGETIGVAATLVDVTSEWRIAELEAQAQRLRATAKLVEEYESAQRIAGLGVFECDFATGEVQWSEQMYTILGTQPPDHLTSGDDFLRNINIHPDDLSRMTTAHDALMQHDEPYQLGVRLLHPDRGVIHVFITGELIRDQAGSAVRMWGTLQDVTERMEIELARREAVHAERKARAELAAEHAALQMVQQAMLPSEIPSAPGVELAVSYQPVTNIADIGGDWYDAFELPGERLAVVVGDVAGHDLQAASAMAQIRNALRAYAVADPRPGTVLQRANALMMALPEADLVTAVYGVYDPATGRLTFARAGHPPPLLCNGGRTVELFEPRGIALGAQHVDHPYDERTVTLRPGDSLLLFTDGLVERRGHDTGVATQRLCSLIDTTQRASAEGIVGTVTATMIDPDTLEDDVCLLVLHRPTVRGIPGARIDPAKTPAERDSARPSRLGITLASCAVTAAGCLTASGGASATGVLSGAGAPLPRRSGDREPRPACEPARPER